MTSAKHDAAGAAAPNLNAAVTGVDRRTLDAIFRHPLAQNLSWREVVSLFTAVGGAEEKHNGEFVFRASGDSLSMKRPHNKDLTGPDVMDLRHFLTRTGWSPGALAEPDDGDAPPATPSRLIVVIDHAGAEVYSLDGSGEAEAHHHLLHHLERKAHDEDRDETFPRDQHFFEAVAGALSGGGEIVVIGHGKGQSNEAAHLSAYLQSHHRPIHARIVREIIADLPRLTAPELVELGRQAFGQG